MSILHFMDLHEVKIIKSGADLHMAKGKLLPSLVLAEEKIKGDLKPKSDVYSFGVVLLELLSGKRGISEDTNGSSEETLVDWARLFLGDNRRVLRIMDTRLGGQYSRRGAKAAAMLALECLYADSKLRPNMADVLLQLEQLQNMSRDVQSTPCQHGTAARPNCS